MSNTSQLYPANFDDNSFSENKLREMNKLTYDDCYVNQRNSSNNKKLKFVTTNHIDLIKAKDNYNFFGMTTRDGLFVPGDKIDYHSDLLNGKNGQKLTSCNVRNGFGALPMPTVPFKGQLSHGNVDIEESIRGELVVREKPCLPSESDFEKRSFGIFDESINIPVPQAIHSVETPSVGFSLGRSGEATRFTMKLDSVNYSSSGTNFKPSYS